MMSSFGGGVLGYWFCDSFILWSVACSAADSDTLIAVLGDSFIPVDICSCVKLLLT